MRLIIILIAFVFCFCQSASVQSPGAIKQENTGSFTLLDSKYEQSTSGYNGARSTDYFFTIKINTGKELRFDSAWIDNRRHAIFISKKTSTITNKPIEIKQGDTVILRVSDLHSARTNEVVKAPIQYIGKALIRYNEITNISYFIVKEMLLHSGPNRQ